MLRTLVLDLRASRQHPFHALLSAAGLVVGAVAGNLVATWFFSALWLGATALAPRSVDGAGPFGVLQTTLGVSRRTAVRARYLEILAVAGLCLLGGALVGLLWSFQGRDLVTVWGLLPVVLGAVAVRAAATTLDYVAAPAVQQAGLAVLVALIMAVGFVPVFTGRGSGIPALVDTLYAGPVPIVAVLGAVAVLAVLLGGHAAVVAYSRADL